MTSDVVEMMMYLRYSKKSSRRHKVNKKTVHQFKKDSSIINKTNVIENKKIHMIFTMMSITNYKAGIYVTNYI